MSTSTTLLFRFRGSALAGFLGVVALCVVLPRALALGFYPYMDEGFYTYWADTIWQSIAGGRGLPDEGFLMLYPALLSWCCALPGNPFVWLRGMDMLLAAVSGFLLCRILWRECGSLPAALIIGAMPLAAANTSPVINAGFRNSIAAAFIPLFLALEFCRTQSPRGEATAGALTAIAVLLREPFAIFAVWGAISLLVGRGPRSALRFCLAGLATGCILLLCVMLLRGSPDLLGVYASAGNIYAPDADRISDNFFRALKQARFTFGGALLLALGALTLCMASKSGSRKRQPLRGLFWLGAMLLPLIEPALKLGFLYHIAVSLPALAGLTAWAWHNTVISRPFCKYLVTGGVILSCILSAQQLFLFKDNNSPRLTAEVLTAPSAPFWPDDGNSNTIAAAAKIRELAPPDGTVSVNCFTYFLYATSGLRPPSSDVSDLTRTYFAEGKDSKAFLEVLRRTPPGVIVLGKAESLHSESFTPELQAIIEESGLYRYAGRLSPSPTANYGWLGYTFYTLK